jgi:hypothetical protein
MKLPNAESAIIAIEKLRNYCLDPEHPRGKHKARVFSSVLGITQKDAEILQEAIARAVRESDCEPGQSDQYGQRFTVDFSMKARRRAAEIRTNWIILTGEDYPRLTSCYVK